MVWFLIIASTACFFNYIWGRFFSRHGLPSELPWAGGANGPVSRANVIRRSFFGLRGIIQDGYYKVRETPHLTIS